MFRKGRCQAMAIIKTKQFGRTGHLSSRAIFGSASLSQAGQDEANQVLELLLKYGINHIDTAPRYGEAELRIGPWMKHHRDRFFLATKTDQRKYGETRDQFYRSLERLQVDHVDLLQLHNLTDVVHREITMGPGGALEFLIEARDKGLTRFVGITGHGLQAPRMHRQSLDRFDFDTVLLPFNYLLMQDSGYATDFDRLMAYCREHDIAVQTIKSIARGFWGKKPHDHNTWYEPVTDQQAIKKLVHWVLGWTDVFLITVGDIQELPKVLEAAASFESQPDSEEMVKLVRKEGLEPVFI
jgi:aryl-alcohol dehydrogenase-like predicted oxidoreductase